MSKNRKKDREKREKKEKKREREKNREKREKKMPRVNYYQPVLHSQFTIPWCFMMFHDVL